MNYLCHSLDLSCAGCHHPATHTQKHSCIGQGDGHGQVRCRGSRGLMPSGLWVLCSCMYPVLSTATAARGTITHTRWSNLRLWRMSLYR